MNNTQTLQDAIVGKDEIEYKDCEIISKAISDENLKCLENGKPAHMIEKTANHLYEDSKMGCIVAMYNDELAACMFAAQTPIGYELGSLYVMPEYRGNKLAKPVIEKLLHKYDEHKVIIITNVFQVMMACQHLGLKEYGNPQKELYDILNEIENGQPLLDTDVVYANKELI